MEDFMDQYDEHNRQAPPNPYGLYYASSLPPRHAPVAQPKRTSLALIAVTALISAMGGAGFAVALDDDAVPAPAVSAPQISAEGVMDLDSPEFASALNSVFTVAVSNNSIRGTGSGVAIGKEYIVTNAHVVNLESEVTEDTRIEVQDAVGKEYEAKLVGIDAVADVAVLEVPGADFSPLTWEDETPISVGQGVIAVGAPLGLSNTVTSGIVSALDRPVRLGSETESTYINAIQTDSAINSGNSGGALINSEGELVGLNVAISTSAESKGNIGIGYAIPAAYVRRVSDELIKTGTASHGVLGVNVRTTTSRGGNFENGARIDAVEPGGAAASSSLRRNDVVIAWDGRPVNSSGSLVGFTKAAAPGSTVTLTVLRSNREIAVRVKVGSDRT